MQLACVLFCFVLIMLGFIDLDKASFIVDCSFPTAVCSSPGPFVVSPQHNSIVSPVRKPYWTLEEKDSRHKGHQKGNTRRLLLGYLHHPTLHGQAQRGINGTPQYRWYRVQSLSRVQNARSLGTENVAHNAAPTGRHKTRQDPNQWSPDPAFHGGLRSNHGKGRQSEGIGDTHNGRCRRVFLPPSPMKLHGGPKKKSKDRCGDTDIQVDGSANPKGGSSRQEQVAHGASPNGRDGGDQDHPQKIHAPFRRINGARESKHTGTKQIQKFQETVGELYYLPVMATSSSNLQRQQHPASGGVEQRRRRRC